jgi:hypothetical protein
LSVTGLQSHHSNQIANFLKWGPHLAVGLLRMIGLVKEGAYRLSRFSSVLQAMQLFLFLSSLCVVKNTFVVFKVWIACWFK